MASRIVQYFADKLKTVKEYPITLTKAVYDENGKRLDNKLQEIDNSISDANNNLSKHSQSYQTKEYLCLNASGVITLDKSIYDYESLLIENNNFGFAYVSPPNNASFLHVGTISMSGETMVLCCAQWSISNNGKTLTPDYMAQANIQASGVTYYNISANLTWNIYGLSHNL